MFALLTALLLPCPALAEEPAPEPAPPAEEADRDRLFMPALELGVLAHLDPTIRPGVLFRTSIDWRFRLLNAPFIRLAYDATTGRMVRRDAEGEDRLVGNLALHDLLVGFGGRVGTPTVQAVGSVQSGLQIAEVPVLVTQPDNTLLVDTQTKLAGVVVVATGMEIYIEEGVAITTEVSGRLRSRRLAEDVNPWAVAVVLGVTSAL